MRSEAERTTGTSSRFDWGLAGLCLAALGPVGCGAGEEIAQPAEIALGGGHTCARWTDGTVQCWGDNQDGELGDGTTESRHTPTLVPGLDDVAEIALGYDQIPPLEHVLAA